jgi:Domain of unknown function (DUF6647)/Transposase DDE domain
MLRKLTSAVVITGMVTSGISAAEQLPQQVPPTASTQELDVPGTSVRVVVGGRIIDPSTELAQPLLLKAIAAWLSSEFDLPLIDRLPNIAFVPTEDMIVLRPRDVRSDRWVAGASAGLHPAGAQPEVVAIYNDEEQLIYLPEKWTGTSPAELSVLVHEMVHHIQNIAALSYECPEAREKLAFAAQERWLVMFGRNLAMITTEPVEEARDVARALAKTDAFEQSRHDRKRVEMLFAHLKRILKLGRLRLRGPRGAQDEFTLAAIAQNLRRLAKLAAQPPPVVATSLG